MMNRFRLVTALLLLAITLCACSPVLKIKTDLGWGGRGIAVSVDPTTDNIVWVAAPTGGLFVSRDGGSTWQHASVFPEFGCFSIKICPTDAKTIIATCIEDTKVLNGGGIWLSKDGGNSWNQPATAIVRSPLRVPRRYGAYGISFMPNTQKVFVGTDSGLAVSNDLGITWQYVNPQVSGIRNSIYSVIALSNGRVITYGDSGIWMSDNGLNNWYQDQNHLTVSWGIPNALAVSPLNNDHLFFTNARSALFYSIDGGKSWKPVSADFSAVAGGYGAFRQPYVKVVRSSPESKDEIDLYYSSYSVVGKKTIKWNGSDFDFSGAWTYLPFKHSDPSDLAFSHDRVHPLYATNDGGVEKTTDGGSTWQKTGYASNDFDAFQIYDVKGVLAQQASENDVYFGTQDVNLYSSGDNATTWPALLVPEGGNFQGPVSKTSARYWQTNFNDQGFQHYGPLFVSCSYVAFPFRYPDAVYFVRDSTFATFSPDVKGTLGLYISTDGCSSWTNKPIVTINQPNILKYAFVSGPKANPSVVVAYTVGNAYGILRIDNAFDGIPNNETVTPISLPTNLSLGEYGEEWRNSIVSFGVDPNDANFMILPDIANDQIDITTDGGTNWTIRNDLRNVITENGKYMFHLTNSKRGTFELSTSQVSNIAFDPMNSDHILIGTAEAGIIYSPDHGKNWYRISESDMHVPNITSFFCRQKKEGIGLMLAVVIDAIYPNAIFQQDVIVSTWGRGLWDVSLDESAYEKTTRAMSTTQEREKVWTIFGDQDKARSMYADTVSPQLLVGNDSLQTFSATVLSGRRMNLYGRRWFPDVEKRFPLIITLDDQRIGLREVYADRDGKFAFELPILQVPGRHILKVTQYSEREQKKELTLELNVIMAD